MRIFEKYKKDVDVLLRTLALAAIMVVCLRLEPIASNYINRYTNLLTSTLYNSIEEDIILQWAMFALLIYGLIQVGYDCVCSESNPHYRDVYSGILLISTLYWSLFSNSWSFATIITLEINHWIAIYCIVPIVVRLVKTLRLAMECSTSKQADDKERPIGFVTDTPEEEKLDIGWRDYCSTIVSTLEATDLSKDCFAIGISGGWGSGKTTFLRELQAQLESNPSYMLIEYNPWNTGNKSDIVENFFKTFSSLVGHRSSLYPHLQRYARALSDIGGIN